MEKAPFFAIAVLDAALTYIVQSNAGAVSQDPFLYRAGNVILAYGAYILKWIWPLKLCALYPLPPAIPWGECALVASIILLITAWVTTRLKRSPELFVGWFWFLGTLVPVIGIVQVGTQGMADRYSYLPSIGLLIVITAPCFHHRFSIYSKILVGLLVIAVSGVLTIRQVGVWKNSVTLFSHVLEVAGETPRGRIQMGAALAYMGNPDAAIEQYRRALVLSPNDYLAYLQWGNTLSRVGRYSDAVGPLEKSIELNPRSAEGHDKLGIALVRSGRPGEGEKHFREAIRLDSGDDLYYCHLGFSLMEQKRMVEAATMLEQTVARNPFLRDAHVYLGYVYAELDQFDKAIEHCERAIELKPDDEVARRNLELLRVRQHQRQRPASTLN
jgi:tetratricopeptide (TPR) repeat protein